MKRCFISIVSLIVLFSCKNDASLAQDNRVIEYQVKDNEYSVAVVQEQGMKDAEAKQLALKKAAALAQKNGYQYFVVEKEGSSRAIVSKGGGLPPPTNMYYDLIQSGNFGKAETENQNPSFSEAYPAYQITFKCYKEKPSGDAIDVCTLMKCQ